VWNDVSHTMCTSVVCKYTSVLVCAECMCVMCEGVRDVCGVHTCVCVSVYKGVVCVLGCHVSMCGMHTCWV
jgi:hypothetical protein